MKCELCHINKPSLLRNKTAQKICKTCFYAVFEREVYETLKPLIKSDKKLRIALCASGGKDSTVLIHVMTTLNERYNLGLDLQLLSIDEGISGYRDDSLKTVKRNQVQYKLPLTILSYQDLYGYSMDEIVTQIGPKNNCTFCGVFRRQAIDRGALKIGADLIFTGHNADDISETVFMNLLRGDIARLGRCTAQTAGRGKPFKLASEKEIVLYAYYKDLDYFSTECTYATEAYRGHARVFLKDLEKIRGRAVIDAVLSGEAYAVPSSENDKERSVCSECGCLSSMVVCKACVLLKQLNRGKAEGLVYKMKEVSVGN